MQELFYAVTYRQSSIDSSDHFMVFHPPENKLEKFLGMFLIGHKNVVIDLKAKFPGYANRDDAVRECQRLGEIASAANPDRIDAASIDPQFPNRTLEIGKLD